MSLISKPVGWQVYNGSRVRPVRYYSILKRKREMNQQPYDVQVFKHGYLHYCGIVPKNISSSLNSKHEIIIVFFNQIPTTSFIGFRVKVSKDTLTQESNSLLLFLKRSKKASFFMSNYIHVQCGTNAWELFYCLYADYLKKYVLTFIGTQFFTQYVYSRCIQKEIQLIDMLYKGSKVIKVSKKSIYYEIHRKRKISVTDLIHMTLNMPSRKKFIISCFSSKEPLLHSHMNDGSFYTPIGTKINVSKLMLKQLKRHSENILSDDSTDKSVNFPRLAAPSNSAFSVPSKFTSSKPVPSSTTTIKNFYELDFKEDIKPGPSTSKFIRSSVQTEDQWEQYQNFKPFTVKSYSTIPCLNSLIPNLLKNGESSHFVHETSYLFGNDYNISLLPSTLSSNKEETPKVSDLINSGSLTLSGCENKTVQVKNEAHYVVKQSNNVETLKTSQNNSLPESQNKPSPDTKFVKDEQGTSKCFDFFEDVSFSTAAGKSINISDTAMKVAQKLVKDDFDEEIIPTSSKNICFDAPKNKMYKHKSAIFKDIDCSSKALSDENITDIDMDNTLVEKFFEKDTNFEEELESSSKCEKSNSDLPSKIDKKIPLQKARRSLGGRRSMKYSSNKL